METAVARPDPVDLAAPDLRGRIRLWHASRGDEGPRDGTHRGRQVVRAARGVARAPPGSAPRLHLVGSIPDESGAAQAESIAPRHPGRAETRRGAAARAGRLRQVRPSHDDPIQDGQEAQLLLRRVLAAGPGRALRATSRRRRWTTWSRGKCSGRWSPPRWSSACEPSRTSSRSASASTTSGARPSNAREQDVARAERQYHAVEPENRLVARTLEARWEDALKKQRQVEEDYHRFLAKLPATLSGADRRTDPIALRERRRALARPGDVGGGSQADRALRRGAGDRRGRQVDRAQRRDDRLAGRRHDTPPGRSARRQL